MGDAMSRNDRDCQAKFSPHQETGSTKRQDPVSFEQPPLLSGPQHWQTKGGYSSSDDRIGVC